MANLFGLQWTQPGVPSGGFHGIDVLLFATLLEIRALDSVGGMDASTFDKFIDEFGDKLTVSKLLGSIGNEERLFPLLGLSLLLQWPPKIHLDQQRVQRVLSVLSPIIGQSFEAFSTFHLPRFHGPIAQAFRDDTDPDLTCREFVRAFQDFRSLAGIPSVMADIVFEAMVSSVDACLVNRIYMQSTKCDFMASIVWNTFSGHARSFTKPPLDFIRFTEAIAVVQMTLAIDANPFIVGDICPHLPRSAILALLSVRELDDDLPRKPDVAKFASVFNLELYADFKPVKIDTSELFIVSKPVATHVWKQTPIPNAIFNDCPFLENIIS
jgi:hypothetical protein